MDDPAASRESDARIYWTAFIGLFFDYYDLYLFIYLEKSLAAAFALSDGASQWLQFAGQAGVGVGAMVFGYLADRLGRSRVLLAVFGLYAAGVAGLAVAWDYPSLLVFRLLASMALGAEWGISHRLMAEQVTGIRRYRFAALLQFALLGGLLAALAARYALPVVGWRWLFGLSIPPVLLLALVRRRALVRAPGRDGVEQAGLGRALAANARNFAFGLALASLTIASGTINVFYARDLPQSPAYTALFWLAVVPGMLGGSGLVRRLGVGRTLVAYAVALAALAVGCWAWGGAGHKLVFAVGLALLNGIPFGLMGAFFNEIFGGYRTLLSGAAYNLGRILAGTAPLLVGALGLRSGDNYLLFTAILAGLVTIIGTYFRRGGSLPTPGAG